MLSHQKCLEIARNLDPYNIKEYLYTHGWRTTTSKQTKPQTVVLNNIVFPGKVLTLPAKALKENCTEDERDAFANMVYTAAVDLAALTGKAVGGLLVMWKLFKS